jgi:hypothetical protein
MSCSIRRAAETFKTHHRFPGPHPNQPVFFIPGLTFSVINITK